MREIAEHILDIAENSLRAGASELEVLVDEDWDRDTLRLVIADNGAGMDEAQLNLIFDPFYTTKIERKRRFGLGLPLLAQMAQATGGSVRVDSKKGEGTIVTGEFGLSHIDRQPLGDVAGTFVALILSNPMANLTYIHQCGEKSFEISTSEIKKQIDASLITNVPALAAIREAVTDGVASTGSRA